MKIIFAGTPSFAASILNSLLKTNHEIVGVLTQPDSFKGRGKVKKPSAVKKVANDNSLKVFQPTLLDDVKIEAEMKNLDADLLLVVSYGLIIPKKILQITKLGCINIHASLLPAWRGAAPIERCLLNGDKETGITFMYMNEGLDTGPMLRKIKCNIEANETAKSLKHKLMMISCDNLKEFLEDFFLKKIKAKKQNNKMASYANKINSEEARINWNLRPEEIIRSIRAFNPKPGAYSFLNKERIKFFQARTIQSYQFKLQPGEYIKNKQGFFIGCRGNEYIEIEEIQIPGKRKWTKTDLLNTAHKVFDESSFY